MVTKVLYSSSCEDVMSALVLRCPEAREAMIDVWSVQTRVVPDRVDEHDLDLVPRESSTRQSVM